MFIATVIIATIRAFRQQEVLKMSHSDHDLLHNQTGDIPDHRFFLTELFSKYGYNGVMTFEGFEHLLENLNLGGIIIKDHDLSSHREDDNGFKNNHPHHEHTPSLKSQHAEGSTAPPELMNQDDHVSHDDHNHHHHENHKSTETDQNKLNNSGAGIWHYMPEFINITSLFQQHHEFANQDNNVVVVREQGCLSAAEILKTFNIHNKISPMGFLHLCPAIIYELDQRHCIEISSYYSTNNMHLAASTTDVWLYSSLAVIVISLCGLLSVAVIPIMQKVFYQTLLQFLVGLAIGSLSGDALLHLLPHAMTVADEHSHGEEASNEEEAMVFRGLVALGGVYFFFLAERLLNSFASFRQKRKAKRIRLQLETRDRKPEINIGEKLSDYRRSSYRNSSEDKEVLQMLNETSMDEQYEKLQKTTYTIPIHQLPQQLQNGDKKMEDCHRETVVFEHSDSDHGFVIQVSDHQHGHSHQLPSSITAVALMVIMGDGLHNFCDGLAIGAAFSAGISGGFSTTVAVFCHELPHELGDFAMLLKTGMSAKQALFYNVVSSVLCFVGMAIGIALGNLTSATKWIFAATAGMFIYIALVDMIPELETSKNSLRRLAIQFLGISIGISIMLLIAIYEHDLKLIMN
ncbi:zinc transporter ZIP10-like [Centruroides vittatus]|uniref:zinc transporter ZIP10-like n=1 Tax=Centruroides vittatus TaxID=120091 RepID=UPI00350F9C02